MAGLRHAAMQAVRTREVRFNGAVTRPPLPEPGSASIRRPGFVSEGFGVSGVTCGVFRGVGVEGLPVCPAFPLVVPRCCALGGRWVRWR